MSERTGMLVHLGQMALKTQQILRSKSTPTTNLWKKSLGKTGVVVIWHLPSISSTRRRAHRTHSENGHKIRVFTREALSLLLVQPERTIHKEDSSGVRGQISGLLRVTRDLSTHTTGNGTCEARCGWTVVRATWDQSWTEDSWMNLIKSGQKNLENFLNIFNCSNCCTVLIYVTLLCAGGRGGSGSLEHLHSRPQLFSEFWIDNKF